MAKIPIRILSSLLAVTILSGLCSAVFAEQVGVNAKPAVDSTLVSYVPVPKLAGRLTIAGSDTMRPLMARLAVEFRRLYPEVTIGVEGGGSKTALEEFLNTDAQARRGDGNVSGHLGSLRVMLLASSYELEPAEVKEFIARHGYEPTPIPIALDAVAVYVHKDSALAGLTLEQVDAIFSKTRNRGFPGDIVTWGQLGLNNGWEQMPIHLYGRDKRSGTQPFFKDRALLKGEFKDSVKEQPGSASVILQVTRDPYGIGYSGIGYQTSTVRALPLAERSGRPYVAPSAETVTNGTYPLSRPLYLYVNKAPDKPLDPKILEFLKFINSREGQQIVASAGVYPLPPVQVARNLQILSGSTTEAASVGSAINTSQK